MNRLAALLLFLGVAACGGGGGDGDEPPTAEVSGRVATDAGAAVAGAEINLRIDKYCHCGPTITWYLWLRFSRSCASRYGNVWKGTKRVRRVCRQRGAQQCPCSGPSGSPFMRPQASSYGRCDGNKQLPCYSVGNSYQSLGPKRPVAKARPKLWAYPKSRIFGTIQFPNGNTVSPTSLWPLLLPSPLYSASSGGVDESGRFWFGLLEPGSYTVDFPPDACNGPFPCRDVMVRTISRRPTPPWISSRQAISTSFSAIPK